MPIIRTEYTLDTNRNYHISCLDGSLPDQKAIILCLHGFGGSKRSLKIERLHEVMAADQLGTFSFNWPAHGDSDAAYSDLTTENCMQDLDQIYDYLMNQYQVPIWCFATSFGGYLAMLYHLRRPEAFEKIMLRSPALKMAQVVTAFMNSDQFAEFMKGAKLDFGFDQPLLLAKDFYEDLLQHDIFHCKPAHPERIRIIHGDRDDVVPPRHSIEYANMYGIDLRLLKGASHSYDHPGDVDWVMEQAREFYLPLK